MSSDLPLMNGDLSLRMISSPLHVQSCATGFQSVFYLARVAYFTLLGLFPPVPCFSFLSVRGVNVSLVIKKEKKKQERNSLPLPFNIQTVPRTAIHVNNLYPTAASY